jgi:hypothetical protein
VILRIWMAAMLGAMVLPGQVVLVSVNPANAVESAIGAGGYNYGPVAAGDSVDVRFHARNTGTGTITITNLTVVNSITSSNFAIVNTSSTPYTVPPGGGPGSVMAIFVRFSGTALSSYSATLRVTYTDSAATATTLSATLLATVVPAPIVTVSPPCTGPDTLKNISFGRIVLGSKTACTLLVQNPPGAPAVAVTLAGSSFTASFGNSMTVGTGLSASPVLTFTPAAAASFSGSLTVGTRTYTLAGTGFSLPLPTPVWTFDSSVFLSGEQHTLAIGFATPSPVTASGFVTLTFTPAAAKIANDVAIAFVATSQRVVSFTVNAGDTALLLNGRSSVVFATGTSAGNTVFTLNAGAFGVAGEASTMIALAPAPLRILAASSTARANDLDVVVTAFDNTYTAGPMSFTFYDRGGNALGSAIAADFSSNFSTYYQGQSGGSSFLMRVSFPVTGDATAIGAVEATLNNAAGAARTGRLCFP